MRRTVVRQVQDVDARTGPETVWREGIDEDDYPDLATRASCERLLSTRPAAHPTG